MRKSKVIVINCIPQAYGPNGSVSYPYPAGPPYASPAWPTTAYINTPPYTVITTQSPQQLPYASPVQTQPQHPWTTQYFQPATPAYAQQPTPPPEHHRTPAPVHQPAPSTPSQIRQATPSNVELGELYQPIPQGFQPFQQDVHHTPSIKVQAPSPKLSPLEILQPPATGENQPYLRLHHRTPLIHTQTPTVVLQEELARRECLEQHPEQHPDPPSTPSARRLSCDSPYSICTPAPMQPRPRVNSYAHPVPVSASVSEQDHRSSFSPQVRPDTNGEVVEVIHPERSNLLQNTTLCAPEAALPRPNTSSVTPRVWFNSQPHRTMLFDPDVPVSSMMGTVSLPNSPEGHTTSTWERPPSTPHARKSHFHEYTTSDYSTGELENHYYREEPSYSVHTTHEEERRVKASPSKYHSGNYLPTPPLSYRSSSQLSSPPSSPEPQTPESCSSRRSRISISRRSCCSCDEAERERKRRSCDCRRRVCCDNDEEDDSDRDVVYVRSPGSSCSRSSRRGRVSKIEIRCT